ncbi:MAG: polysaccharide export protein [Verrucomicrobia bacterium]|nr:polysaccharide export protein [Verrucomicrobiota bacterium]
MGINARNEIKKHRGRIDGIERCCKWRNDAPIIRAGKQALCVRLLLVLVIAGLSWLTNWDLLAAESDREGGGAKKPEVSAGFHPQQATVSTNSEEYRIRAGDSLSISVFQEPDLSQKAKVTQSGSIRHPLLGVVQVEGLTTSEAEKKITGLLAKDYLVNPRVSITVDTYRTRRVTLLGEVKQPGIFEIPEQESMTLLQVVGRAGGFTNIAATDRVAIIRTENGKEQVIRVNVPALIKSGDKSKDIELKPGDVISVPETFF